MKLGNLSRRWIYSVATAVLGVILTGCPAETKKSTPPDDQKAKQGGVQPTDDKEKQPAGGDVKLSQPPAIPADNSGAEKPAQETREKDGPATEKPAVDSLPASEKPATEKPAVESPATETPSTETTPAADAQPANEGEASKPMPADKVAAKVAAFTEPTTAGEGTAAAEGQKPADVGEPVVDKPEDLKRLDKEKPLWLNPVAKQVVMIGRVCQTAAPLEMFACIKDTKEHEAILSIDVDAFKVHAALVALGAEPGNSVRFIPSFVAATGPEVEITLGWKSKDGKKQTARAQDWIRDVKTEKALESPFVFGGSGFWTNTETKETHYLAQGGDFICVSNFPSAMLDLPMESSQQNAELDYQVFTERVPPKGTPVTVILTPKLNAKPKAVEDVKKGETKA